MTTVNWNEILYWADQILFLLFVIPVGYLLIFGMASLRKKSVKYHETKKQYRYAIFLPANKGYDNAVLESVKSFLDIDYPKDKFDIVVIANSFLESTIQTLKDSGIVFIEISEKNAERKYYLEEAMKIIDPSSYDVAILMKPNNSVDHNFIYEINKAYHSGGMAIQTHRISKNVNSNIDILSSMTEEINNSIFRRGHVNLGFSASLIGSGMVFNYKWLYDNIIKLKGPGITKQLEAALLQQGVYIEYLEDVFTYDEKSKNVTSYIKQRQDWSESKCYSLKDAIKDFPKSLFAGNFDYCDKIFQWMMPSRFILFGFILLIALLIPAFEWTFALKWWILLGILLLSFSFAIPEKTFTFRTFWAFLMLPVITISIITDKIKNKSKR
jgi:hypothetical protein